MSSNKISRNRHQANFRTCMVSYISRKLDFHVLYVSCIKWSVGRTFHGGAGTASQTRCECFLGAADVFTTRYTNAIFPASPFMYACMLYAPMDRMLYNVKLRPNNFAIIVRNFNFVSNAGLRLLYIYRVDTTKKWRRLLVETVACCRSHLSEEKLAGRLALKHLSVYA